MISELQHQIRIDTSAGDLPLSIECLRCPWGIEMDAPITLADVITQVEAHFDASGRCDTTGGAR